MKKNLVEIFIEKNCRSCEKVLSVVGQFSTHPGFELRTYDRRENSQVFRDRRVVICAATFVNQRLVFYGAFTSDEFSRCVQSQEPITIQGGNTMDKLNLSKAVAAGIAGTSVMTVMTIIAPMMGMPEMNIPNMLSDFMGMPVVAGWLAHFIIGTVLALVYAYFFLSKLPGSPAIRGAVFAIFPWLLAQVMVNPVMGAGVFAVNTPSPLLMIMGSLIGHIAYGVVVGVIYGSARLSKSVTILQN